MPAGYAGYVSPKALVVPGYTRTAGRFARANNNLEKKYLDSGLGSSGISTTGTFVSTVIPVVQGTTDQTRIGNKITVKNFSIRCAMSMDDQTTGVIVDGHIRVIVYIDKQANGATAATTDILTTAALSSYRNMDTVDRFVILKDKWMQYKVTATNALHTGQGSGQWWKWSKKLNLPVHYAGTTGAITEIKSNNIGVLFISDLSTLNMSMNCRTKFLDG